MIELMKQLNGNKQMKDVWKLPAIARWEKSCGKHPTQKPLSVLTRIILASTKPNAWILDPFAGSSTTGIAANLANRRYLGIDMEKEFLEISKKRKLEIENPIIAENYKQKISGFSIVLKFITTIKFLKIGLFPLTFLTKYTGVGDSYHMGSSTFVDNLGEVRQITNEDGLIHNHRKVYSIDSSTLHDLEPGPITYEMMMNAVRIAIKATTK